MSRIYGTLSLGFSLVLSMFMSSSLFFFAIQQGKDTGQDIWEKNPKFNSIKNTYIFVPGAEWRHLK